MPARLPIAPQFPEIVVSVARKTDAALWPALFAAIGSPLRLCQGLMQADQLQASFACAPRCGVLGLEPWLLHRRMGHTALLCHSLHTACCSPPSPLTPPPTPARPGSLQSASCCLVIVEQIEGSAPAQHAALQLMQAALGAAQYGLAADLLRFLVPPGEGEALVTPSSAAAAAVPGGEGAGGGAAAGAQQPQQAAAAEAAAAAPQEVPPPEQPPEQQAAGGGSWFWGLLGMGGSTGDAGQATAAAEQQQQAAAAQAQQREQERQLEQEELDAAAAGEAWRLTAQHAWKLLDSGALRWGLMQQS